MSLEQTHSMHRARRILKALAPDFHFVATNRLEAEECVLDLNGKTIEIAEVTPMDQAVAAVLFNIGHIYVRATHPKYRLFYGSQELHAWHGREPKLIRKLARLGVITDKLAAQWALEAYVAYWPIQEDAARSLVARYVWPYNAWLNYFSF